MFWLRPPVVAGRFYPREKEKLLAFLEDVCPKHKEVAVPAIMAPHAGFIYSGKTAGDIYQRIQVPEYVFILCPNHTGKGPRISIWSEGAWETPLGRIPVAEDIALKLMRALAVKDGDMLAHIYEHAIEVQLPFLQYKRKDFKIIPVVLGHMSQENCLAIGVKLGKLIQEIGQEKCLVVASSDMSHYVPAEVAKILDTRALEQVKKLDAGALYQTVVKNDISMCGFIPTTVTLETAKGLGATHAELISYTHSGEVTGDSQSVVAYANALIQ